MDKIRIQKYLATLGYGSRRAIEKLIVEQRIQINGKLVQLGDKADSSSIIFIDGKKINTYDTHTIETKVLLYNKPMRMICSKNDPQQRLTVFTDFPQNEKRWILVGRLDFNTSGLLLITNNGELANRLMHPSFAVEREYMVKIHGNVTDKHIDNMITGITIDDELMRFDKVILEKRNNLNSYYRVILHEGKNREVRKLWESQDLIVSKLIRVRYAFITLPRQLEQRKFYVLNTQEIIKLKQLVKLY